MRSAPEAGLLPTDWMVSTSSPIDTSPVDIQFSTQSGSSDTEVPWTPSSRLNLVNAPTAGAVVYSRAMKNSAQNAE